MSQSESRQMDEQTIIYQEQQVLWAKIRGYPWWPAFVDKVHGAKSTQDDQMQYTVFFFGDNTHSRLGASKLRRFLDYYTEFFPKAKTNRKLYLSIMKAEEKLKQNGGNIQIFQTLRNSMKKPKKGKGHYKTESKISSEDLANNINSQMPELMRHKTYPNNDSKQQKQKQNVSQQQSIQIERQQPKKRGRKPKRQVQKQEKKQVQKIEVEEESQQEKNNQQQVEQSQQQISQIKKAIYRTRSRRGRKQGGYKVQESQQQNNEDEKQSQSQSENEQLVKKTYSSRVAPKTKPLARGVVPKKRGRPKKIVQQLNVSQSQSQQQSGQNENQKSNHMSEQKQQCQLSRPIRDRPTNQNRKSRNQRAISHRVLQRQIQTKINEKQAQIKQKQQTPEQLKQLILERVKFCLNKRDQLIQYLDDIAVTTDIVKEILDLDVSTIILEGGQNTAESIRVLHKLKSALLHKYFPDDIKIKKKYQKMSKKSQSRTTSTQNQETLQDLELRRKTIIKLEKILKNIEGSSDQKDKAIQIEGHFRKSDQSIGNTYKTLAYKVLRSLKDKNNAIDEIVAKLEAGQFEDEGK